MRLVIVGLAFGVLAGVLTAQSNPAATSPASQPAAQGPAKLEFRAAAMMPGFSYAPAISSGDLKKYRDQLAQNGPEAGAHDDFRWFVILQPKSGIAGTLVTATYDARTYVLLSNRPAEVMSTAGEGTQQVVITQVRSTRDAMGRPSLALTFDEPTAGRMKDFTTRNTNRFVAAIVNEAAMAAPLIKAVITDEAVIQSGVTPHQMQEAANALNSLATHPTTQPAATRPVTLRRTHP